MLVSKCCNADYAIAQSSNHCHSMLKTYWHQCKLCQQPCDLVQGKNDAEFLEDSINDQ